MRAKPQRMVLEGATPRQVDGALEDWGMAMGILAVFDMAGIDVGVNVHKANASRYPAGPGVLPGGLRAGTKPDAWARRTARVTTATRRATARASTIPRPSRSCAAARSELQVPQRAHTHHEIQERCLFPLLNEGFHVLGRASPLRAADIDVVWTSRLRLPALSRRPDVPCRDHRPQEPARRHAQDTASIFGPMHWQPAPLLVELVERGMSIAEWEREQQAKRAQA